MTTKRISPPTDRVVAMLDHFLANPTEAFGLSELTRALDISKPTCLGIATSLANHGYLSVHSVTRAYSLGPAFLAAGRIARQAIPAADLAEARLRELANAFRVRCAIATVVGTDIVVLGGANPDGQPDYVRTGLRYPFAPPVGIECVLWDSDAAIERWINEAPTAPVMANRGRLEQVIAEGRRRGYVVEALTELGARVYRLLAEVAVLKVPDTVRSLMGEVASTLGERVYLEEELNGTDLLPINLLAAPVYDSDGRQQLVLTMHIGGTLTPGDICTRGAALRSAAEALTSEVGGATPSRRGATAVS